MSTFTLYVSPEEIADELNSGPDLTEVLSALAELDEDGDGDVVARIVEGFDLSASHKRIIPFLENVIEALKTVAE